MLHKSSYLAEGFAVVNYKDVVLEESRPRQIFVTYLQYATFDVRVGAVTANGYLELGTGLPLCDGIMYRCPVVFSGSRESVKPWQYVTAHLL